MNKHEPFYWAPTRKPGGGWLLHKDSPSPPAAPDYVGQAKTQGAANLQSTLAQSILNRPTEITPYGTKKWTQTGTYTIPGAEGNAAVDIPTFQSSIDYTPLGQQQFDQQQRIGSALGNIAETGVGRVNNTLGTPFDMSKVPTNAVTPDVAGREAITAALLARQQPGLDTRRQLTENNLLIQGHNRGGEAWNATQNDLNQAETDARMAAITAGGQEQSRLFGLGQQGREQAIQEQAYLRSLPLNEMNALRSGSQVATPTFGANVPVGAINPANIAGAGQAAGQYGQNVYNQQVGAQNANTGAVASLGAAALMNPMIFGGF